MKIKSIKKIKNYSLNYDLTVKNNHNFFANNILVHNCSIYPDYFHARSIDSDNHESRNYVKNQVAQFQHDIPKGWRICGENLFAKHSIFYDNLESYLYGFSIWNEKNECLSWDNTLEWFELFGVTPVPVLYYGIYDYNKIRKMEKTLDFTKVEGYVIRNADSFHYKDFRHNTGKFVRENHIQDVVHHWKHQQIVKNKLKG